jgi:uncharacterized RDD family membrane protein YckC
VVDDDRTHYDILGIEPDQEHLEAAQGAGDNETSLRIRRAWQVLSDPVQRGRYDDSVGLTRGRRPAAGTNGSSPAVDDAEDVEILDDDAATGSDDDATGQEVEVARDWRGRPRPDRPARPRRELPPAPPMAEGLELPTLGRRLAGDLIDVITLIAIGIALLQLGTAVGGGGGFAIFAGGSALAVFLYMIVPVARTGQTLGKRLTYTMAVDRLSGSLLTSRQLMIRYAIPTLLGITGTSLAPIGVLLGFTYAFGPHQVSLLDRMSKSIVVVARYQPVRHGYEAS